MYTIGLDVSIHETGVSVMKGDSVIHTDVISCGDKYQMLDAIKKKINKAMSNIKDVNNLVVVIEDYTETMLSNDRTNRASDLISLKNKIIETLSGLDITVARVLPWAWRKCYGLSTRVLPVRQVDWKLARSCGHNILKDESITLMKRYHERFNLSFGDVEKLSDDEIEATLIAKSFLITSRIVNHDRYDNVRYVNHDELEYYKSTLPSSVNTGKVWK